MRDKDDQGQPSPGGYHFPQLHRWGIFPEEMLKSPWLCSLEVNSSRKMSSGYGRQRILTFRLNPRTI